MKEALKYIIIVVGVFVLVRGYDYITKKPVPVDRTENPEITALNKRINAIMDSVVMYKAQSSESVRLARMSLDSMRVDHKKSNNEHKTLNKTPDASLIHYRDSIRRANGL
jgi:hypothetical protein